MKRKLLAVTITGLMAFGGTAAVAAAGPADGSGNEGHGFCTAYFSGSEQGQQKKREKSPAFQAFEAMAEEWVQNDDDDNNDSDVGDRAVEEYCRAVEGGFGNPGGGNVPYFEDGEGPEEEGTGSGTGSNDGKGNGKSS